LIGPIAASNRSITPSRSASSVTAAIPDTGVNDQSGGADPYPPPLLA